MSDRPPKQPFGRRASDLMEMVRVRTGGRPVMRKTAVRAMKTLTAGIGYGFVEPRLTQVTHIDVPIAHLPQALDGYRILHLTDIHYKIGSGRAFVERVVRQGNALDPDLVALTGDFITHNPKNIHLVMKILSELKAPDGLIVTRGNHDYKVPFEEFKEACDSAGMRILENEHIVIEPHRRQYRRRGAEEGIEPQLIIAGVGDLWEGICRPGHALRGADPQLPIIMLSHNPHGAELLVKEHAVDLMLSGHTHGGQVCPMNKPIRLLSDGTVRYVKGLVESRHTTVYISRGVGTSAFHFRWNCRPEIALVTLRAGNGQADVGVVETDVVDLED